VLWEKGEPVDLLMLATADSNIVPLAAEWINDSGEIAGWGLDASGDIHAFKGIPTCHGPRGSGGKHDKPEISGKARKELFLHMRIGKSLFHLLNH
jgi:hypothetical protein